MKESVSVQIPSFLYTKTNHRFFIALMVFSSIVFLLYFLPVFLITYLLTPARFKNIAILLFSILFYSWGAPKFIFVILGTTLLDYFLVKAMDDMQNVVHRRLMLALSISINMGLLVYFKYSNFFIENVNELLALFGSQQVQWTKVIMPIGISFYTFETITYVVDVYRKEHKPADNFWDYQVYIILFPKLIAGPIIRYTDLADQLRDRSANDTIDHKLTGLYRFVIGLAKKVLIANHMGQQADCIFAMDYTGLDSFTAWTGILAYTFQIYFDFSGYSDMAIGLGRFMGFRFPENFNSPYTSSSITEFWRRWHMTLGAWMRNYLYIPLGGNRVSATRLYLNLGLVFLASGLWHGASWNFVLWGAYHGFFLIIERLFLNSFYARIGRLPSTVFTFLFVVIGWVFFKVETFTDALRYLQRMFAFEFSLQHLYALDIEFRAFFIIAAFFSFFSWFKKGQEIQDALYRSEYGMPRHYVVSATCILLFMLSVSSITAFGFNPFIYFRF